MPIPMPPRFEDTLAALATYFQAEADRATDWNIGGVVRTLFEGVAQELERHDVNAWGALNLAIDEAVFNAWGFARRAAQPSTGVLSVYRAGGTAAVISIAPSQQFRVPGSSTQVYQVTTPPAVGSVLSTIAFASAWAAAATADSTRIYVSSTGAQLTAIDLTTNGTAPAGGGPLLPLTTSATVGGLAAHPTLQRLYATLPGSGAGTTMATYNIDPAAGAAYHTVIATTTAAAGTRGVAIRPDGTKLFVACAVDNSLKVYNMDLAGVLTLNTTVTGITTPQGVAVNPLNNTIYVTSSAGLVVIHPTTFAIITTIPNTSSANSTSFGISVNPTGTRVYVVQPDANMISVVDATTNTLLRNVTVGYRPQGVVANPVGTWVYVTNTGTPGSVSVLDALTGALGGTLTVGGDPQGMALPADGRRLLIANHAAPSGPNGGITLVDTTSTVWTVPAGAASANVNVQCVNPGSIGNVAAGVITEAVPPVANIVQLKNVQAFTNGLDAATDSDRRSDFRAYLQALPRGTVAALTAGAKTSVLTDANGIPLERVRKAHVFEGTSPGTPLTVKVAGVGVPITFNLGMVAVFIHNGATATSNDLVNFTQRVIDGYTDTTGLVHDGWRPAGVATTVYAATEQTQAVTVTNTSFLIGYQSTQVLPLIQNAIVGVFAGLDVGDPLYRSALYQAIRNVPGVADYILDTPASNLTVPPNVLILPGTVAVS